MAQKLSIAIDALSQVAGGSLIYLKNILPLLNKIGNRYNYLLFVRDSEKRLPIDKLENFRIFSVPLKSGFISRERFKQFTMPKILKKENVSLLFSPTDITCLIPPCPIVLAIRNLNPYFPLKRNLRSFIHFYAQKIITKISSSIACRVIFVSDMSRNIIVNKIKVPYSKTSVIYHGINREKFSTINAEKNNEKLNSFLCSNRPYFITVSTIHAHKNYKFLIQCWSEIHQKYVNYKLLIIGRASDLKYYTELQSMVKELKISDSVYFLEEIDYKDMPLIYKYATAMIFPSHIETFGHPLVEAMASGVPLIASNAPSIPEIVDNASLLFDPEDKEECINHILSVIENKKLREELIVKGIKRSNYFSWEKNVSQLLSLFDEVLLKK